MPRLAILLLASLSTPLTAAADTPAVEAKQHVAKATALHREGQFAQALLELKTAYALDPRPPLLFAMGQLHVRLGECAQAITFYERFLATRPAHDPAALAAEAIQTCRTAPPDADPAPAPPVPLGAPASSVPLGAPASSVPFGAPASSVPLGAPAPSETVAAPAPAPVAHTLAVTPGVVRALARARPAWYENYVADGLVLTGVVSGAVALLVLRSAHGDRDAADARSEYGGYEQQVARARTKQVFSAVLGVSGAALITAGGLYFWLSRRGARDHGVQIAPTRDGGTVSWSGRF